MWGYNMGWGLYPFIPFFWILFWFAVIYFFFGRGRRWHGHMHDTSSKDKSAEEVLADRFANGEIDEKEYEHRLEVLRKHAK